MVEEERDDVKGDTCIQSLTVKTYHVRATSSQYSMEIALKTQGLQQVKGHTLWCSFTGAPSHKGWEYGNGAICSRV